MLPLPAVMATAAWLNLPSATAQPAMIVSPNAALTSELSKFSLSREFWVLPMVSGFNPVKPIELVADEAAALEDATEDAALEEAV